MPSANRKILITGAAGFIGSWLVAFLRGRGEIVTPSTVDLLEFRALESELARAEPDVVIHLAAITHVPTCELDPSLAFRTNVAGTAGLLEAMRRSSPQARLVFASSAQVYKGPTPDEGPDVVMDEMRAIAPQNLYARTKWESELLIEDATRRDRLQATVLRLFNHTHKSQSAEFFLPHLYKTIVEAMVLDPRQRIRVPVGNLDLKRDIGSIFDLVAAFGATLDRTDPDPFEVFAVCSGAAKRLSSLAAELATRLGADVEFVTDPTRVRVGEPDVIRGSHERLTRATGWRPRGTSERELVDAFLADDLGTSARG